MQSAIQRLGLASSLQLCLDARDKDSYTSGQKWLDRSGNGYDFFVGADGSATATDPTFTGTAGMPSGYFAFDGGDYFTYDTTNETWIENLHKDNAVFTMACWAYIGVGLTFQSLFGTRGASAGGNIGCCFDITSQSRLDFTTRNGATNTSIGSTGSGSVPIGRWVFLAISYTEATPAGFLMIDAAVTPVSTGYTTPTASNASFVAQIGSFGNASLPLTAASRMAAFAAWSRALSQAELLSLFSETRQSFGV